MPGLADIFSNLNVPSQYSAETFPPQDGGGFGMSPSPLQINPYAYPGSPPTFLSPLPPNWQDLPERHSPAFLEAAKEYVGPWLRESRAYAVAKQPEWQKWSDLWKGKRSIWSLGERQDAKQVSMGMSRADLQNESSVDDEHEGQTDFVYPIAGIVTATSTNIFNSIFSGANPITVEAIETSQDQGSSVDGYTIAQKLTKLFVRKLDEGRIRKNVMDALITWVNSGHVFGKAYWSRKYKTVEQIDLNSGEKRIQQIEIRSCPVIAPLKLDRVLMDYQAVDSDVDGHRGIGHWTERTYDEILATFDSGGYTLNRTEVMRRWSENAISRPSEDVLDADPDKTIVQGDPSTVLWVWEWHGEIPFKGRLIEGCMTWVTEPDADSPEGGVVVRCSRRPALACGIRPIKGAQLVPNPGQQLGIPLIGASKDIHYQLSQAVGQFSDGVRHQIQCGILVQENGAMDDYRKKNGAYPPGLILACSDPSREAAAMPSGSFQPGPQLQLIQELRDVFQRSTVTDTFIGMSGTRKTASEAALLQQQSSQPSSTFAMLFVKDYLEPLLNLALYQLQNNMTSDETITVRGRDGQSRVLTVSSDEVRSGKFRAVVTLTEQDALSAAKAQSIERMIPVLQEMEPVLAREGTEVKYSELIQNWLNLLDTDGTDRVLHQLTPEEQMQRKIQQQAQMQAMQGQSGQQPPPPGGAPQMTGENGGPMGPNPSNDNLVAQLMQQYGSQAGPGAGISY